MLTILLESFESKKIRKQKRKTSSAIAPCSSQLNRGQNINKRTATKKLKLKKNTSRELKYKSQTEQIKTQQHFLLLREGKLSRLNLLSFKHFQMVIKMCSSDNMCLLKYMSPFIYKKKNTGFLSKNSASLFLMYNSFIIKSWRFQTLLFLENFLNCKNSNT